MSHPESGEGLKGPYTVTRPVDDYSFDIIYRVIPDGRKACRLPHRSTMDPAR